MPKPKSRRAGAKVKAEKAVVVEDKKEGLRRKSFGY
jgi:hypothetical protein